MTTMMTLQIIWFMLIAVLIVGYALLDGFDLGVGNLHLLTKNPDERKRMMYSIGPFWDANQVWLLTGGGAIFAAFPMVYASVFSGFYLALMLVLLALIFRAVSIELQHQLDSPGWKKAWDLGFGLGSIVASLLFGVAMGNILRGIPLDAQFNYVGDFFGLLNPYSIVLGLVSLSMFTMHGASYLIARTDGQLAEKARAWGHTSWMAFVVSWLIGTVWSYLGTPRLFVNFFDIPLLWMVPLLAVAGMAYYPTALKSRNKLAPFLASSLTIVGILGIVATSLFPYMVPSSLNLAHSLTIFNASSSQLTLSVMLILALIGVPIVLGYTAYLYRTLTRPNALEVVGKTNTGLPV